MIAKRIVDIILSTAGLVLLLPFFAIMAVWIKLDSPGPVFFRQTRVGRLGKAFRIYKFRTMVADAGSKGLPLTVGKDPRITASGGFLRHFKLDELPQLINVLKGEMSLVGPRPEVPRYVELYPIHIREKVLSVSPGITDFASIEYRDESLILARAKNPEAAYIEQILPEKLEYYQRYVSEHSLLVDLKIIMLTLKAIIR